MTDDYFDLGSHVRQVTTSSLRAQAWFDRGLNWAYAFNFEDAVRCFEKAPGGEDINHVEGSVDPVRDLETIATELILADQQTVEGAIGKAERAAKSREPENIARYEVLKKLLPILSEG